MRDRVVRIEEGSFRARFDCGHGVDLVELDPDPSGLFGSSGEPASLRHSSTGLFGAAANATGIAAAITAPDKIEAARFFIKMPSPRAGS